MATLWQSIPKPGSYSITYDDRDTYYDQLVEQNTGLPLYYDTAGLATVWTAVTKP